MLAVSCISSRWVSTRRKREKVTNALRRFEVCGWTPLLVAAQYGYFEVAKYLLEQVEEQHNNGNGMEEN
jgi:hypothetical protein